MNTHSWLMLLVFSTSGLLSARADDERPSVESTAARDPWHGFPKGSWIIIRETIKQDERVLRETREKHVLTAVPGDIPLGKPETGTVVSRLREVDGEFNGEPRAGIHIRGFVPESVEGAERLQSREEELLINGKSHRCQVATWRIHREGSDRTMTCTIWKNSTANVPYRELATKGPDLAMTPDVLKAEIDLTDGEHREHISIQVASTRDKVEVDGQTLTCVREEGTGQLRSGDFQASGRTRRWLSAEIPGHDVRLVAEIELEGQKRVQVREVVEFHVPRLDNSEK